MKKIIIGAFIGLFFLPAFANDSYFSGEILIGKTDLGFVNDEYVDIGDDTSFGIRGAYNLNTNIAFEFSYVNQGETNDTFVDEFGDTINDKISSSAFNFAVKGSLPFENGFSVHARLGLSFWDVKLSETDSSISSMTFTGGDSGNDLYYGLGAQYPINEKFTIGAEYTLSEYGFSPDADFSDADNTELDVKTFTLAVGLKF